MQGFAVLALLFLHFLHDLQPARTYDMALMAGKLSNEGLLLAHHARIFNNYQYLLEVA